MSVLCDALTDYLHVRRALGYKLVEDGNMLQRFVAFVEEAGSAYITTELALQWVIQSNRTSPARQSRQLSRLRLFAEYLSGLDPRTQIPPRDLLPTQYQRRPPYLYSDCQIRDLVTAAGQLPSTTGLRAHTYATLLGLLAVTGLRIGEAITLDCDDVDLREQVLLVRQSKFAKDRLVPLHPSATKALNDYVAIRRRCHPCPMSHAFFLAERGTRLTYSTFRHTFILLSRRTGLRVSDDHHGPRPHDLRHTFAVRTVQRWYREGLDANVRMPLLSAFLGHDHVSDTYWYLSAVPELMALAAERLDKRSGGDSA